MTDEAKTRLVYAQAYAQAVADLAESDDRILLMLKLAQRDHELEVAAMAAAELHQLIAQLEQIIVNQQSAIQQKVV